MKDNAVNSAWSWRCKTTNKKRKSSMLPIHGPLVYANCTFYSRTINRTVTLSLYGPTGNSFQMSLWNLHERHRWRGIPHVLNDETPPQPLPPSLALHPQRFSAVVAKYTLKDSKESTMIASQATKEMNATPTLLIMTKAMVTVTIKCTHDCLKHEVWNLLHYMAY